MRRLRNLLTRLRLGREESTARRKLGMPLRHPERLTVSLSDHDEEWLGEVCIELWPADEYADITREEGGR